MNECVNKYAGFLRKYLHGDALLWVVAYGIYVHSIDDIIDNEVPNDVSKHQFILQNFEYAETVYTNNFYLENLTKLRPLVKMASIDYMNSVALEKSDMPHHKVMADHLRTTGNAVILACIEICGGIEKRNEASLELREISYGTHHLTNGEPV